MSKTKSVNLNDGLSKDEPEIPAQVPDTMETTIDFLDDNEWQHIYNVALGE